MFAFVIGFVLVAAGMRSIWVMAVEQAAFENENEKVADQKHKEDLESAQPTQPPIQTKTQPPTQTKTQPPTQPTPPLPGHSFPTPPRSVRKLNGVVVAEVELECN
jgi:hypothetical protein